MSSIVKKRAYIYLNSECNLNCIFCASDTTNRPVKINGGLNDVVNFIKDKSKECNSIVISGGEPTVDSRFFDVLCEAIKRYERVQIMTNGLLLADRMFLEKLVSYETTDICIPVVSPDPIIFNKLVGKNAFWTQFDGICNLLHARSPKTSIQIKTIIQAPALESFTRFYDYFSSLPASPDYFIINGLHLGEKVINRPSIIPDYENAGKYVSLLIESLSNSGMVLSLAEFPLCLLSLNALDILSSHGFPISANDTETIIFGDGRINKRKSNHVKTDFCLNGCLANYLCDGLPSKNIDLIEQVTLQCLKPINCFDMHDR